ncbi:SDR family NAD(P)-dependent oxidoreductase [Corynebacterium pacaense]|uniref:SDR family NAD(P)-dependent oxidoreductase n=1 Tax=Corynebacterium pacaense TaxID=1816684 RepID=UPI0009BA84EF|nr:SDR family oxidoreductase [Corynebacterium pacaense]
MTTNTYAVEGRTVIITGAGSGMGREIARGFLDNGARVVAAGRRLEPLEETISGAAPERAVAITADVSDRGSVDRLVAETVGHFGGIDVIVSNAAIYIGGELADLPEDQWRSEFAVNVDGLYHLVAAASDHLVASKGSVTAISSVSGLAGDWGQAAYNASKHAVNGLIRSLALDYGDRGVRFNAVAPAFTATDMTSGIWKDEDNLGPFLNRIALGRVGRPGDVVGPVLFLSTDDASYITGSILTVDGGTSASTGQPHA